MEVDITKKVTYYVRCGLLGIVLLVVLAAGGVYLYQHQHRYLTVYEAQIASATVAIKAQSDGVVQEMLVEDGAQVEAGTVIARVKPNVTEEQIAQFQQTVDLAERNLKELQQGQTISVPAASAPASDMGANAASQQNLANAAARMQRMNELFEMGAISAVKRDEAVAEYEAAQAAASITPASAPSVPQQTITQKASPEAIKNAELQLKQAKAALESAQLAMKTTEIVAPVAGTVSFSDMAAGAEIKAGDTVARIGDANDIWVEAQIPSAQKKAVRLGAFISYTLDGANLQGTVQEIVDAQQAEGEASESDSGEEQMMTIKISVPSDASVSIKPGMDVVVKIPIDTP